jgi:hypothetical protein
VDIVPITVKMALVRSRIAGVEYVINPYLGCAHGCSTCYAAFMRKYSHLHLTCSIDGKARTSRGVDSAKIFCYLAMAIGLGWPYAVQIPLNNDLEVI